MGVAGCGKSAVGEALADALGWPFYDGDDFHPPENVARMAAGIPLNDADRAPWLAVLRSIIVDCLAKDCNAVLACSALKQRYRQQLSGGDSAVRFVYLRGDYPTVLERLQNRRGHYMQPEMLRSQFAKLEEPAAALAVEITQDIGAIVAQIIQDLHLRLL
jgi:gluconokinase